MSYKLRRSSHGGDRRHGRSLIETLTNGNDTNVDTSDDETYDETVGPRDMVRRPNLEEWGERAEGTRIFDSDKSMADVYLTNKGKGKVQQTWWDDDPKSQYERYVSEQNWEDEA